MNIFSGLFFRALLMAFVSGLVISSISLAQSLNPEETPKPTPTLTAEDLLFELELRQQAYDSEETLKEYLKAQDAQTIK